jgi:hypothetical protein
MIRTTAIQKTLSRNDTGETGGHQAGMLVPKKEEILSFFPELKKREKNPRFLITFSDSFGERWSFSFIYYNNSFFGGSRNEYRLTGMTRFMQSHNLKAGDVITLSRNENGFYVVEYSRLKSPPICSGETLKLGNSWKIVRI